MTVSESLRALRVDNVGSMLRPPRLLAALARAVEGEALRRLQDDAIAEVVAEQEAHGLPLVVDGEFRRRQFMESFADVAGFDSWAGRHAHARDSDREGEARRLEAPSAIARTPATERLRLRRNVPLEEFAFAQALTERPVKVTLIGPERIFSVYDREGSRDVYADPDEFLADVVAVLREMIAGLVEAGCRYVHVDAPGFTRYADPVSLQRMRDDGLDPDALLGQAIAAENAVIEGFDDVTLGIHLCRGNERSRWHREGTYEPVAERLFGELRHDRLLLEYDDERAGGFEPLRHARDDATVVLGLITTKTGAIEDADALRQRIDEAARHVPLERLALSPQCGFASVSEGNLLTVEDQWRKLDLMLEVAESVWG
jgi:5-methyltetrahydropteroyltriglutamate--homocysteine methyltransferase